ncbi:MAG: class I SAM-dependent methyltransferase [Sulfurisoma sp.]|nr:class I SAM-dependent methyltransferase [Sulfurisoma sp.]
MDPAIYRRMAATQHQHWWFAARREILAQVIETLALPSPNATILEIGCGTGANLPMLARFGTVCAMENDAFSLQQVKKTTGIDVRDGSLPDRIPFDDRRFDLICVLDVLEHVKDDGASLETIRRLLAPGGRILVTTPAYQWLYSSHDTHHHHFRRYTSRQLAQLARTAGLVPTRIGYFNTLLFPLAVVRRLYSRLLPGSGNDDTAMPGPLINGILRRVFMLEAFVARRWFAPFGVSVIAILSPS